MRLLNGIFILFSTFILLFALVAAGYFWIIKGDTLEAIMYMCIAIFLEISNYIEKKKNIE